MTVSRLANMTYEEVADHLRSPTVALLPCGAIEAHGPHLPIGTDNLIAENAASEAASRLDGRAMIFPTFAYSVADYASEFAGTISIPPEAAMAYLSGILRGAARAGYAGAVLCNAHLDPANVAVLRETAQSITAEGFRVEFPDITRKPHALRLGDEFRSGACHAGRFETSLVLAAGAAYVNETVRTGLAPNPSSLAVAIRAGKKTFIEAGGPRAYFGWPADATEAEGRALNRELADIFAAAARCILEGNDPR